MAGSELAFQTVLAEYRSQGVAVHDSVVLAGQRERSGLVWTSEMHPIHSAIACAGILLRAYPGTKLASDVIEIPDEFTQDTAALALARITNASVQPITAGTDRLFVCSKANEVSVCADAEKFFAGTIEQLRAQTNFQECCEIIIDDTHVPILVRKSGLIQSALSLEELVVNGIPYPAGSLFRANMAREYDESRGRFLNSCIAADTITMAPAQQISMISFMRLSAFALQEGQSRSKYAEVTDQDVRVNHILRTTPSQISDWALQHIGSTNHSEHRSLVTQ